VGAAAWGVVSNTLGAGGLLGCGTVRVSPAESSTEARGRQSSRDPDSRAACGAGPRPADLLLPMRETVDEQESREELGTRELHELLSGAGQSTQGHSLLQFLHASAQ
jgi:hypothetical protein